MLLLVNGFTNDCYLLAFTGEDLLKPKALPTQQAAQGTTKKQNTSSLTSKSVDQNVRSKPIQPPVGEKLPHTDRGRLGIGPFQRTLEQPQSFEQK